MEKSKIERINFLARKSKTEGLTEEEKVEQQALRNEYREGFRRNLTAQLNNTYFVNETSKKLKISERNAHNNERKEQKQ